MKTWLMNDTNDITTTNGVINVNSDVDAIANRITSNLQTIKGELDNPDTGVDYFNIIFSNTPISTKVQELTRVIQLVDGVTDVKFLDYELKDQVYTFHFFISTIYGPIDYSPQISNPAEA